MTRYIGTAGNDAVVGTQYEADVFSGFGAGTDKIEGGKFNDTFALTVDDNTDYIAGGLGEDRIDYSRSDRGLTIGLAHNTVSAVFYDSPLRVKLRYRPLKTSMIVSSLDVG